jgi:hypothetical protein
MIDVSLYYWKDSKWLKEIGMNDHPEYPTIDQVKKEYVKLPITLKIEKNSMEELEKIFGKMNMNNNPMATEEMQKWKNEHGLTHTDMSVGDIIEVPIKGEKKVLYVCEDFGFADIFEGIV